MLKKGTLILSGWYLVNVLPGVASLISIFAGRHAPGFQYLFKVEEIAALDTRAVQTVDGIAILANALIVAFCLLSFFVVQKCLARGERWAFFVTLLGILLIQGASYWSDSRFLEKNFWVINVSSAIFGLGIGLCAVELFFAKRRKGSRA